MDERGLRFARARSAPGHRQQLHPTRDGYSGLWSRGARDRHRSDRRGTTTLENKKSAAAPVTAHARHDDGAARPIFLDVSGIALTHGVRAGIVTGIALRGPFVIGLVARIDLEPGRRL